MPSNQLFAVLVCFGATLTACNPELTSAEYLQNALASERDGELRTASIQVRNALKDDAENADARLLLGTLQLRIGDFATAEKELKRARELGAEDADVLPSLALALRRQNGFDELKALDGDGLSPDGEAAVLANRAYAHLADGDPERARRDADRALELAPDSVDAELISARLDAVTNDLDGASARLSETLAAQPDNVEGWELLGDIERAAARPDEALAAYDAAVERFDRAHGARLKRAQLRLERGEDSTVLADLDALSGAGISLPAIDFARGQLDLREGELPEAQLHFETALQSAPDYPPALGGLALTHLALGNSGQAEQYGKQMMASTNESDAARRLLGAIRLENGRYDLAAETIEPVLRSDGGVDPFSARLLNAALLKQDRHDEAIERMASLTRTMPAGIADGVDSPLVLARAPSEELIDDLAGGADALERSPGEEFLDENDRRIARVIELLGRGQHDEALAEAETLRREMPDSAVPHNLVGRVHAADGRTDAARAAFEQALEVDEGNVAALKMLAELDLGAGNLDGARARLEEALRGEGDSQGTLLSLARIEAQAGDESAMLDWIERARSEYSDSAAPTLFLASYRVARAEHALALAELERLDDAQRAQPAALQLEGTSLLVLRRYDEAIERYDALVRRQPGVAEFHYRRAQARAGLNENVAMLDDLGKALDIAPTHVPSLLAMANFEILRRDFAAAEGYVDTLRDLIPGRPELDAVVARLSVAKEEAPADDEPSRIRIDTPQAALQQARAFYEQGEPGKAAELLVAWLDANPDDIAVRLTLANAYGAEGREDEAVAQYETLLEAGEESLPTNVRLASLNNLAWYLREQAPERAIDYAERALEVTPDSVATLDTLAMIHFGQGNHVAAKAAFDRAAAIGVEDPTVRFHGARIEAALGNDDAARALLEPLVDEGAEFPESEDAARLLEEIGRSGG